LALAAGPWQRPPAAAGRGGRRQGTGPGALPDLRHGRGDGFGKGWTRGEKHASEDLEIFDVILRICDFVLEYPLVN